MNQSSHCVYLQAIPVILCRMTIDEKRTLTLSESLDHGHEVGLQIGIGVLESEQTQRVDGLLAHGRLLDSGQRLERLEQAVHVVGPAHQ